MSANQSAHQGGSLVEAVKAYLSSNKTQRDKNTLASLFYKDVRAATIIRSVLIKQKMSYDELDELRHRVIVLMFDKILDTVNEPDGFYSLWYKTAQNVGSDIQAENSKTEQFASEEAEVFLTNQHSISTQELSAGFEEDIATKLAHEKFDSLFDDAPEEIKEVVISATAKKQEMVNGSPEDRARVIRDDHKRLGEIRESLHLSIEGLAALLSISSYRLSAYLYGKTKCVPEKIMKTAEELLLSKDAERQFADKIVNTPISVLFDNWAARTGLDDKGLARLLGISNSTMERWKNDEVKPDLSRIAKCEQAVRKLTSQAAA